MKQPIRYIEILSVMCWDIKILTPDIYSHHLVKISYKVKRGHKVYTCWVEYEKVKGCPFAEQMS